MITLSSTGISDSLTHIMISRSHRPPVMMSCEQAGVELAKGRGLAAILETMKVVYEEDF